MSITPTINQSLAKQVTRGVESGKVFPPVKRGTNWIVRLEIDDALDGPQVVEKAFRSEGIALDFYTEVWLGMSRTAQVAAANAETGMPGMRVGGTTMDQVASGTMQAPHQARIRVGRGPQGKAMNLRKVTEVLVSYGLDPTEELVDVLTPVECVDPDTGMTYSKHRLAPEERAKILLELLQYAQPKLKAVEMKIEGTLAQMTQEQIDNRLRTLLAQAAKEGAK